MNIANAQVNPLCSCQSSRAVLIIGRRKLALLQSGMAFSVFSIFMFIISIRSVPISLIFFSNQSCLLINLIYLIHFELILDPWFGDPWSSIHFFSRMCGLRVEELPRTSTMIEQWLLYTNWRQTQTHGLTIWLPLILTCLVTACVEMKPLRVP